jgi:hypothetical protein
MIIEVRTARGDVYNFDPDTMRVYKDSVLIPSSEIEPVFSDSMTGEPEFSGLWIKSSNQLISRSGNITTITDPNTLG